MDGNHTTAPTPTGGRRAERKRDARTDGGYILVTLGLMIIPLMAFAALAVDVGSWYARTTEMQKAADAAALAGVVWAPDYAHARTVAAQTLTDNGFTATSAASQTNGNITITMTSGSAPNSFKVTITDAKAPVFFSKVFTSSPVSLTRSSTAVYYLPIPMGSPLDYFGGDASKYGTANPQVQTTNGSGSDHFPPVNVTGNPSTTYTSTLTKNSNGDYKCVVDPAYVAAVGWKYFTGTTTPTGTNTKPTGMPVPNPTCVWNWTSVTTTTTYPQPIDYGNPGFWANIMAPESDASNGDAYSPKCYGGNFCSTTTNNSYADHTAGYIYTLTMGPTAPTSVDFKVFDAGLYARSSQTIETGDSIDSGNWTTHFDVFAPDGTPLDITDNPHMSATGTTNVGCSGSVGNQTPNSGSWALSSGDAQSTFENAWVSLCHINNPVANAQYVIKVRTDHSVDGTTGSGSNRYALHAVGTGGGTMQLSAYANMAIYNNVDSGSATFYLAEVKGQYAGKTLDINLWDPGDVGGSTTARLTINAPGVNLPCTWVSNYGVGYTSAPSGNGAGGTPNTPTSGSSTAPCTIESATSGTKHFNGNWLAIRVPIPTTYTCTPSTPGLPATLPGCWWSITYNFSSTGNTDNTTWAVNVEGDPIHLTQ